MSEQPHRPTAREIAIAATERELAEFARLDELRSELPPRRPRKRSGGSMVYSIRLSTEEVALLETRAELQGIGPTVLARNLIRVGLAARDLYLISDTVGRLEQVVHELRAIVP